MFITFEGIEGAGKSTAINYLAGFLQENGLDPLCTREPGGCDGLGEVFEGFCLRQGVLPVLWSRSLPWPGRLWPAWAA